MSPDEMDLEQAAEWLDQLGDDGRAQLAKIEPLDRDEIEQLHFHAPRMVKLLQPHGAGPRKSTMIQDGAT